MFIGDFVGVSESKGEAWVGAWGYVSAQPSPRQVRLAHLPRGKAGSIRPCKPFGLSAEVFEALFLSITYRGDDVEDDLREEVRFVVAPMSDGRQPRTTGGRGWHLIPLDPLWVGQPMVLILR